MLTGTTLGQLATSQSFTTFGELDVAQASYGGNLYYEEAIAARDKLGRITQQREQVVASGTLGITNRAFGYDRAGRLQTVDHDGVQSDLFAYDNNGNRTAHTTSLGTVVGRYDDQDRLVRYCPEDASAAPAPTPGLPCAQYQYSAAGELLSKTEPATGDLTSFDYDEAGALRSVQLPDGRSVAYELDAAGRRVGRRACSIWASYSHQRVCVWNQGERA